MPERPDDGLNDLRRQVAALVSEVSGPKQVGVPIRGDELGMREVPRSARTATPASPAQPARQPKPQGNASATQAKFVPLAPESLAASGVSEGMLEGLLLRFLSVLGKLNGVTLAEKVGLPFGVVQETLTALKTRRMIAVLNAANLHDFVYELTEVGQQRAALSRKENAYLGPAPVPLTAYTQAVAAQSARLTRPTEEHLRQALSELHLPDDALRKLGRSLTNGKGLFLYGSPGNGKTSIAERITAALGGTIWIPYAIEAGGEVVQLFDAGHHVEQPLVRGEGLVKEEQTDRRWVRIQRPTIIVGGEMTLDDLEITIDREWNTNEASLQLKSNCGTFVIDDFGRQRISPEALLNRWIVPLEKRYDFLRLASGRKIRVPFDQFIVFSTNLEPRDLVDEAFLRRIPYKIDVRGPSEAEFADLFLGLAQKRGIDCPPERVLYLLEQHYRTRQRVLRYCHARDLLDQIESRCRFDGQPLQVDEKSIDGAVEDYFASL